MCEMEQKKIFEFLLNLNISHWSLSIHFGFNRKPTKLKAQSAARMQVTYNSVLCLNAPCADTDR